MICQDCGFVIVQKNLPKTPSSVRGTRITDRSLLSERLPERLQGDKKTIKEGKRTAKTGKRNINVHNQAMQYDPKINKNVTTDVM